MDKFLDTKYHRACRQSQASRGRFPNISNEGQTDINLVYDKDTDRGQSQEGMLINAHLGHEHRLTLIHTTSDPSAPSIPRGISSEPTTVLSYLGESASKDKSKKLQKPGNLPQKLSSQSSQPPAGILGETLNQGPYPCDICGKRYAQPQGVRRHYKERHDHPNSCAYCNFKWSRPYLYRAHLKTKHSDVSDAAQDEATWTSYRAANHATSSRQQQQPALTLTPEEGQQGGTKTWSCLLTLLPSAAVEVTPALLPQYNVLITTCSHFGPRTPSLPQRRSANVRMSPDQNYVQIFSPQKSVLNLRRTWTCLSERCKLGSCIP
jgi:hypothetical protein